MASASKTITFEGLLVPKIRGEWFKWASTNKWGHGSNDNSFMMTVEKTGCAAYLYTVREKAVQYGSIASGTVSTLNDAKAYAEEALLKFILNNIIKL